MSFGERGLSLHHTNVSRPQLVHSGSKQSITASEDFHSFSSENDQESTFDEHSARPGFNNSGRVHPGNTPNTNFDTPRSRFYTPPQSNASKQSNSAEPAAVVTLAPATPTRLPDAKTAPSTARERKRDTPQEHRETLFYLDPQAPTRLDTSDFSLATADPERQLQRQPPPSLAHTSPTSGSSTCASPALSEPKSLIFWDKRDTGMDPISPSTTPGVDDSPYIVFALDQLTRDEEVRGSRHYTAGEAERQAALADAPPVPPIPLSGRGPQAPRLPPVALPSQSLRQEIEEDYPVERLISDEGLGYMARQKEMQAGTPPRHPLQQAHTFSTDASARNSPVQQYEVFIPYDPPHPTARCPKLNFVPGILRPLWLGIYILLCILMLIGLIFTAVWSKQHDGIWGYDYFGSSRYFVFEYLPTMLGMILLIWLIQIQVATQRIAPFMAMAANSTVSRSQAAFVPLYPSQFLYPRMNYFGSRQPILGAFFTISWLFLFTVPLLASSYNVRWFGPVDGGQWRWLAVQGVIWTTITLYILQIIALVILMVYLIRVQTGLKWDPRSLADIIALLERANMVADYADSEVFTSLGQFRGRLWNRTDRLGYWHTSRRQNDIFYGLGEEGGATRRYSLEQGRIREKTHHVSHRSSTSELNPDAEAAKHSSDYYATRADLRSASVRLAYKPWNFRTTALLAFVLIAVVLYIAFLVVSFIRRASIRGFFPRLQAASGSTGFSPANFVYSFIPALLGLLLFLLWQPLDYTLRRMAPFKALSDPMGATAEQSLLLEYPAQFPLTVSLTALVHGDYLVAFASFLTLAHAVIPILAGGIWWAQWYPGNDEVRVAAHPSGFYALCVFLAFYALGFIIILFVGARGRAVPALPHQATCLAEIVSWIYMSPLITDRAFSRVNTKAELVSRLVSPAADSPAKKSFFASVTNLATGGKTSGKQRALEDQTYMTAPDTSLALPSQRQSTDDRHPTVRLVPGEAGEGITQETRIDVSSGPKGSYVPETEPKTAYNRLSYDLSRFGFGIYIGRDGREHLGIDRLRRGSAKEMLIFSNNESRMTF